VAEVDFDADAFASAAAGDSESLESHVDAEGAETSDPSVGSTSTWKDMLLSTAPEKRLEDVEDPWNPELGKTARIYRGLQKMADFEGMPAIGDILIGMAELAHDFDLEGAGDDDQDDEDGATFGGADVA
jgi:hypothetical protein